MPTTADLFVVFLALVALLTAADLGLALGLGPGSRRGALRRRGWRG